VLVDRIHKTENHVAHRIQDWNSLAAIQSYLQESSRHLRKRSTYITNIMIYGQWRRYNFHCSWLDRIDKERKLDSFEIGHPKEPRLYLCIAVGHPNGMRSERDASTNDHSLPEQWSGVETLSVAFQEKSSWEQINPLRDSVT
jgi:hypothetical protein